jgi:hypothetical protein
VSRDPLRRTPGSKYAGGHRSRVTPVPIPNTEVKPATADGTARETAWESRSLPAVIRKPAATRVAAGFSVSATNDLQSGSFPQVTIGRHPPREQRNREPSEKPCAGSARNFQQ